MTAIVGILCKDGVVIGADSSATFGSPQQRTIEQSTSKKIEIFGNTMPMIVAGTGFVGHHQRFIDTVKSANARGEFSQKREIDVARHLAALGKQDFGSTGALHGTYSSLVAYAVAGKHSLCELDGNAGFQPELKVKDDLWFASNGSGMVITDPFLALFRQVFWNDSAPNVRGGVFTAYWALHHACEVNPGGINHPIRIATLETSGTQAKARIYTENELAETHDVVNAAIEHMRGFRDVLLGQSATSPVPTR